MHSQDFLLEGETKPQITRNDVINIFLKERLFTGQRYRRMEDQKPGPGLACNLGFAKEKDLNLKLKRFPKLSKLEDVVRKYLRRGSGGRRWAIFWNFFWKKTTILMSFGSHLARF